MKMRRAFALLWLVVTLVVIAACAATSPQPEMSAAMPAEAPSAAMPEPARDMAQSGRAAESGGMVVPQQVAPDPRKMIYTGNIGIMVKDPAAAMQQIQDMATGASGYTSQAQLYQYSGDLMRGMIVIRVPAESYDSILARIRELGSRVLNETSNASDVTAEYTDLEAQLRNLEAAERELQALLTEVRERPNAKPSDILEVFNALSQKRGEIEQVKGRLQYLANQVGFSTITVDLVPDEVTAPVIDQGWQPLVTVKNAFRSLVNILQGLVELLINLVIVVLPVALLLALPIVLLVLLVRWLMRRRKRSQPSTTAPTPGDEK
jgi:hypothetical protein